MKHTYKCALSVLLALILLLSFLPSAVFAGGSVNTVMEARVFVHFPMGGGHPNMSAQTVGATDYTVDFVHYFDCYDGQPVGAFLPESHAYVAGRYYACQVHLVPKSDYEFTNSSGIFINNRTPDDLEIGADGSAYATVFFTAALGTVTVTFDTCGHGTAHAPVEVPKGGTLSDAVADVSQLDPTGDGYRRFVMWSRNPVGDFNSYNAVGYMDPITEPTTLYAAWALCEKSVDLYVQVPSSCLESDVGKAVITVPQRANYSVEPDWFYAGLVDGYLHPDLIYNLPFTKGQTYYSRATVYLSLGETLPEVNLYGGRLISKYQLSDYEMEVIYSVTAPSSVTQASVYIETPKAGQSAISAHPTVTSLTPGVEMSVWGWYTNQNAEGEWYDGTLVGGTTYYALVRIYGGGNYNLTCNNLKLAVQGKNVKLVKLVDLASGEGVPNLVGAIVAVTVPKTYSFTVEAPLGGKFRTDRQSGQWVTIMDFGDVEEGPITLEAQAEADRVFKMWYAAGSFELLSKDAEYTFYLDRDVHIKAEFAWKPPFVDVGVWDYYYEPVIWAIGHEPAITAGVDETHFGPKAKCTREQIMTFLWKAAGEPAHSAMANPFTDVKAEKYYYDAVLWAVENGITSGVGEGKFGVGQSCTREQAMTFLWKACGAPEVESTSCPFTDVKPGKYYYNAVLWALEEGITSGISDTEFGVGKDCTRAQIITFLYKAYGPKG